MYNELTENDIKKMEEEIEYRKLVVRKNALEAVKEARSHGDLSENFEYHAAKKEKNQNESRIRYLERMIRTAKIVTDESKDDEAGLNNLVDVYFEDDDETERFKLVTTIRGNSLEGRISTESPIGKAIFGHKVGDRVYVEINEKQGYYIVIKNIEKIPDELRLTIEPKDGKELPDSRLCETAVTYWAHKKKLGTVHIYTEHFPLEDAGHE